MKNGDDILVIARVVHESIRAYQAALGETASEEWEATDPSEREAALAGIRFVLAHRDAPPAAQHEQWLEQKRASGWRYGPVKDDVKKTHPSFIPYVELSETERRKDMLFRAIVLALTSRLS